MGQTNQPSKPSEPSEPIKEIFKVEPIKAFNPSEEYETYGIFSLCLLKDKRLVSGRGDGVIEVYDESYQLQIQIDADRFSIYSMCALRNGGLASASYDIKIWRIGQNDYELICTLKGNDDYIFKVIESEDAIICSCSNEEEIRIWDNKTWKINTKIMAIQDDIFRTIIEMNDFIISAGDKSELRIWKKSTYECIKTFEKVCCYSFNALAKLNDNTVIVAGGHVIYVVDIETYKVDKIKNKSLGYVACFTAMKNRFIFVGNQEGEIRCYDLSTNQIISKQRIHYKSVTSLVVTEDAHLISGSYDNTIYIHKGPWLALKEKCENVLSENCFSTSQQPKRT